VKKGGRDRGGKEEKLRETLGRPGLLKCSGMAYRRKSAGEEEKEREDNS